MEVTVLEQTSKTMSSREIASQTGKTHANVLVDIRKMLKGLGVGELKFQSSYLTAQNKQVTEYLLPQREAMILAGGYDVKVRAWFVDYFLEAQKPMTQLEMIIASAKVLEQQEQRLATVERAVAQIEVNKTVLPKPGYASVTQLSKKTGFSYGATKEMIEHCSPKSSNAMKQLRDGSVKPYVAYKIKTVMKYAKKVRQNLEPVGNKKIFFRSKYMNNKFQLKG